MSLLEFIASLADSLAWPTTLVGGIYILRAPAGKLIERVTKLKYGELEAEFQERLKKVDKTSGRDTKESKQEQSFTSISLEDLADVSPRAAVLEAWITVEKAISVFCEVNKLHPRASYQDLFFLAKEKNLDIEAFQTAYNELRLLRNKAVHATDYDITSASAKQYVKTASFIAGEFSMRTHNA